MKNNDLIRLLIVDDHKMFLEGIRALLNDISYIKIQAVASHSEQALKLLENLQIDVLITDIEMPDIDGIELTEMVKTKHPNVKILAVSSHTKSSIISRAIDAGVHGYVLKNTGPLELLKALNKLYKGENYFGNDVRTIINESIFNQKKLDKDFVKLSNREEEILILISQEKKTQEIAETLFISPNTVEVHRRNLMRKIGTNNMVGLVKYAIKHGFIKNS